MTVFSRKDHEGWQQYMRAIVQGINQETKGSYILKGGTGLLFGHGLTRHSVDLDFDALDKKDILQAIKKAAEHISGETVFVRQAKDTDTVQRFFVHIGQEKTTEPLKIETSFRRRDLDIEQEAFQKDGMRIYKIAILAELKLQAITGVESRDGQVRPGRMKARDIYDAAFLFEKYAKHINPDMGLKVKEIFDSHGLDGLESIYMQDVAENDGDSQILAGKDVQAVLLNLSTMLDKFEYHVEKEKALNDIKLQNALEQENQNNGRGKEMQKHNVRSGNEDRGRE